MKKIKWLPLAQDLDLGYNKNMSYIDDIRTIDPLTLDDIIAAARKHVPTQYTRQPWTFPELNHGVAVLKTTDAMNCYMASYGQAHKEKIDEAVKEFPWKGNFCDIS